MIFGHANVRRLVRLALDEDLGRGDVTTAATIPAERPMVARVFGREALVAAGLPIVATILEEAGDRSAEVDVRAAEGVAIGSDTVLCEIRAEAALLLGVERVILNFLQRMSGVATLTRRYVDAIAGTRASIVDTRKTVPGWRVLDKYAVTAGGGRNHRFGLDDGILIKDNHIAAAGSISVAVRRAKAAAHHLLRVEVECELPAQVDEALRSGADAILLDNMKTAEMAAAVARVAGRALVEASGGVTLARVREIAETGVDLISVGAITHSVPAVDLSMDLTPLR